MLAAVVAVSLFLSPSMVSQSMVRSRLHCLCHRLQIQWLLTSWCCGRPTAGAGIGTSCRSPPAIPVLGVPVGLTCDWYILCVSVSCSRRHPVQLIRLISHCVIITTLVTLFMPRVFITPVIPLSAQIAALGGVPSQGTAPLDAFTSTLRPVGVVNRCCGQQCSSDAGRNLGRRA